MLDKLCNIFLCRFRNNLSFISNIKFFIELKGAFLHRQPLIYKSLEDLFNSKVFSFSGYL